MSSYCGIAPGHEFHGPYHDTEYGFPTTDETILFERLAMEIMQAGLSWVLILKKRQGLNTAFANFDVDTVANFDQNDIDEFLIIFLDLLHQGIKRKVTMTYSEIVEDEADQVNLKSNEIC